jgi:hypothetical protein
MYVTWHYINSKYMNQIFAKTKLRWSRISYVLIYEQTFKKHVFKKGQLVSLPMRPFGQNPQNDQKIENKL